VPAYLRSRGLSDEVMGEWHIGYAPRGWTTLTDYLRSRGHGDEAIQAAGLARISSRGTLIDHFRDRVMLPFHDEHGTLAGFIGRAHPGADPAVPKYLNSPETSTYKKVTCCSASIRRAVTSLTAERPSSWKGHSMRSP
jgi:DNA primase